MARIKEKMAINLARLPNYTCVQTVERSERRAPAKRVRVVDTLRLEVAMVNGNEMYSWPGASGFEEKDLRKVVPTGTIGNGAFGLHARSVFLSGLPIMTYAGDEELDGEMLVRYDYKVGSIGSGYTLRVGAAEGTVPYHGSFWAHPETHDLVRLDVIADVIPPHIPVQSAHKTMEYARVVIGASSFLLPRRALLKLVDLAGNEHRNEMHFSDCRQYSGESFISFGEPPPLEETAPVEAEIIKLPTGLLLNLKLDAGFQAGETMVGDVVTATVRSRVRRKKEVIVPKGARVVGRLVHLNKMEGRVEYYTLAIRLDTLEFDNKRAPLSVELESVGSPFGGGASMNPNFPGATIEVNPHIEDQPNVGVFYVQTGRLSVSPGLAMQWRTTE
ncbi:MAG: hypothetical protein GY953_19455 [bacterium]|nr:hypothetical protein [bacterium]